MQNLPGETGLEETIEKRPEQVITGRMMEKRLGWHGPEEGTEENRRELDAAAKEVMVLG